MTTKIQTHKPLPGAWELIVNTWKFFTSTWETTIKTSVVFLYIGIVIFLVSLAFRSSFETLPAYLSLILFFVAYIAVIALMLWLTIRLTSMILRLDDGKKAETGSKESKSAWGFFLPFLWINILVGIIVFGGTILLVLPGIYLGIVLAMADTILLDKGTRGLKALSASQDLVRGRWWGTFWRLIAGGIVFGVLVSIVNSVLLGLVSWIAGTDFLSGDPNTIDLLSVGVTQFLQMAVFAVFMPLLIAFQVKVYRALVKTR